MAGEDKAMDIVLDRIWELKQVGVSMFIIGHTKLRTMTDELSGLEYDMLTTNMSQRYFNAIKNKLHILGVASLNRNIEHSKITRKGKEKTVGQIVDESRVITFRDDNFCIDSKSRFADIVDSIPLGKDEFIQAIKDAILIEFEKQAGGKSIEDVAKEQEKEKADTSNQIIERKKSLQKNIELIEQIKNNIANLDTGKMQEVMAKYGIKDFQEPSSIKTDALEEIVALIK